ncbi:hypothetical protein [Polynucleobacter sp. UB-Siik-W21]|uniref:hypothetical protein n=1 Tax=Polynucleobacter sp. UB-Siik-W21 TaxID=1855646 RepID=UPI001BFD9F52|nr:hypothetical protein [Polynucleobacter sp. UB-Siik-W21]QWD70392.1 hypothetical protein C2756_10955 [Polynucleobacter sp. UB-Siik-W21]
MQKLNGWIRLYIVLLVPLVLVISVWTYVGGSKDFQSMLRIVNNQLFQEFKNKECLRLIDINPIDPKAFAKDGDYQDNRFQCSNLILFWNDAREYQNSHNRSGQNIAHEDVFKAVEDKYQKSLIRQSFVETLLFSALYTIIFLLTWAIVRTYRWVRNSFKK